MKRHFLIWSILFLAITLPAQQWETSIELNGTDAHLLDGCCNTNNETVFVGRYGSDAYIVKVNEDGTYEEKFFHDGNKTLIFSIVNALEDGNYFVAGLSRTTDDALFWVLILNENLDVVTEHFYENEEGYSDYNNFGNMRSMVDDDGTIVATTCFRDSGGGVCFFKGMLYRFTAEGECIRSSLVSPEVFLGYEPECVLNIPNSSDFLIAGAGVGNCPTLIRYDYDFTLVDYNAIHEPVENGHYSEPYYTDFWLSSEHLLMVGTYYPLNIHNEPFVCFGKIDMEATIREMTEIDKPDTLGYACLNHAMCTANDSTIYIVTQSVIGNWMGPRTLDVYVADKDLEILGNKSFYNEMQYPMTAIVTNDDGLVTISDIDGRAILVKKFLREDFNPIPCSVKDVPRDQIKALAFPNPTSDKLFVDISDIDTQEKQTRIKLFDMHGRICLNRIIRGEGNLLMIDLSSLNSGTYSYQITSDNKVLVCDKFIKN